MKLMYFSFLYSVDCGGLVILILTPVLVISIKCVHTLAEISNENVD